MPLGQAKLCRAQIDDMLDALIGAGGPFDDAALYSGVFTAIVDREYETEIGDVTRPTGAAAPMQAVSWGTPYVLNDGSAVVDSAALVYTPAGSETASISGAFLGDTTVPVTLKAFAHEAPPVPVSLHHPYSLVWRLVVDPSGRWSVSFSWNG